MDLCHLNNSELELYLQPYNKSYVRHRQKHQHTQGHHISRHSVELTMECRRCLVRCGSWPSLELSAEPKQTLSPRQAQAVIARRPQDLRGVPALPPTLAPQKKVVNIFFQTNWVFPTLLRINGYTCQRLPERETRRHAESCAIPRILYVIIQQSALEAIKIGWATQLLAVTATASRHHAFASACT